MNGLRMAENMVEIDYKMMKKRMTMKTKMKNEKNLLDAVQMITVMDF